MIDQAAQLRSMFTSETHPRTRHRRAYAVAVTSGKGGVGKTTIAVNLALLLGRSGRHVRLVDADMGLSNAEVLLGIAPRRGLGDVVRGEVDLCDAWTEVQPGVKLLSSGSGIEAMANLSAQRRADLIGEVIECACQGEVVVIDTPPGIDDGVVSIVGNADEVVVVTTPEPTSVTDTYAAVKVFATANPGVDITLVTNACSSVEQGEAVAEGLEAVCRRFLERSFQRREYVPRDAEVLRAVLSQKPLVMQSAHSGSAAWLRRMAMRLNERVRLNSVGVAEGETVEV